MTMQKSLTFTSAVALLALVSVPPFAGAAEQAAAKTGAKAPATSPSVLARGKYLLYLGSCNDCHTDGFAASDGKLPEKEWLLGGPLGFNGPWGTTYAPNLRLTLSTLTESQWVKVAKELKTRPPMPWFNLNHWTEPDLRAFYQYVRSLGPVGKPAPEYLPPDKAPPPPFLLWPAPPKR
jgi:mono/diheme cytochrome c family protein